LVLTSIGIAPQATEPPNARVSAPVAAAAALFEDPAFGTAAHFGA
jgi:hypothetical protein